MPVASWMPVRSRPIRALARDGEDPFLSGRRYALVLLDLAKGNGCIAEYRDPDELNY
jgi:hypothetical protein